MVPARAGVIPDFWVSYVVPESGSRASGGDPLVKLVLDALNGLFPRERG